MYAPARNPDNHRFLAYMLASDALLESIRDSLAKAVLDTFNEDRGCRLPIWRGVHAYHQLVFHLGHTLPAAGFQFSPDSRSKGQARFAGDVSGIEAPIRIVPCSGEKRGGYFLVHHKGTHTERLMAANRRLLYPQATLWAEDEAEDALAVSLLYDITRNYVHSAYLAIGSNLLEEGTALHYEECEPLVLNRPLVDQPSAVDLPAPVEVQVEVAERSASEAS